MIWMKLHEYILWTGVLSRLRGLLGVCLRDKRLEAVLELKDVFELGLYVSILMKLLGGIESGVTDLSFSTGILSGTWLGFDWHFWISFSNACSKSWFWSESNFIRSLLARIWFWMSWVMFPESKKIKCFLKSYMIWYEKILDMEIKSHRLLDS